MATLDNRLTTDPFSAFHPDQRVRIVVDPKMNSLSPNKSTPNKLSRIILDPETNEVVPSKIEQTTHVFYDPNAFSSQSPANQAQVMQSTENWYTFPGNANPSQNLRNSQGPEDFKTWPGVESPMSPINLNKSFTKDPKPMETSGTYKKEGAKLNGSGYIDEKDLAGVSGTPVYHSNSIKEVVHPPQQYVPSIGQVTTGIYDGTTNLKTLELADSHPTLMDQVIAATTPRNNVGTLTSAEKSAEKKKISLGERMAQLGIFSNDKGNLPINKTKSPPHMSKTLPNPPRSVSPFRYNAQANGTPGEPGWSGMTYEIRNFFDSLEKAPAPKGFTIERWEREPSVRPPRDTPNFEAMQSENRDPNLFNDINSYRQSLQTLDLQKTNSNQSYHSMTAPQVQQIENLSSISNKDLQGPNEYMRGSQTIFEKKEKSRNSSFIQEEAPLSARGSVTSQKQGEMKERLPFADIGNNNEALNTSYSKNNQPEVFQAPYIESKPISIQLESRMSSSVFDFGKAYDIDLPEDNTGLHNIVLDNPKTGMIQMEPNRLSVTEVESLRKRNEFLQGEIAKYQADMLRKSAIEEQLYKENGFLKGEIERYKQELQKKIDNEDSHLKENAFLRNKIVSFDSKLHGINTSISQLAEENRRLNEDLMGKIRELETYKKDITTPFDNPFGGSHDPSHNVSHIENIGGGDGPRFSEKIRPTSPMHDFHDVGNMSMDMAYVTGVVPENFYANDVNSNTPRRRIFEKVNYEKPKMVLNVDDFATV